MAEGSESSSDREQGSGFRVSCRFRVQGSWFQVGEREAGREWRERRRERQGGNGVLLGRRVCEVGVRVRVRAGASQLCLRVTADCTAACGIVSTDCTAACSMNLNSVRVNRSWADLLPSRVSPATEFAESSCGPTATGVRMSANERLTRLGRREGRESCRLGWHCGLQWKET